MTFARFEELVKAKHPDAEIFKHGEFAGNKINVAVIFHKNSFGEGKVYQYNGTYCEVLNRLGVKAIYKHDLDSAIATLEQYIRTNGEDDWFGGVIDNTAKIAEWTARVADYEANFVIV
jgi:hypothetical protein